MVGRGIMVFLENITGTNWYLYTQRDVGFEQQRITTHKNSAGGECIATVCAKLARRSFGKTKKSKVRVAWR